MSKHLFIFQIGPVQSFIAQARRTNDLYVGSRILSMLAREGIIEAARNDATLLFPMLLDNGELPDSIPHRFAFLVDTENPQQIGERIETYIRYMWWENYGAKVRNELFKIVGDGKWVKQFETQVTSWLEVYWCGVAVDAYGTHTIAYQAASALLAARKAARHFPQAEDEAEAKCTMTGAIAALPLNWNKLQQHVGKRQLRDNEQLGAIALLKRFAGWAGCDLGQGVDVERSRFRSTTLIAGNETDRDEEDDISDLKYPYLAVLHMDGDRMGELLSQQEEDAHAEISKRLSRFSEVVKTLIEPPGELVYAGGDDVLAFLPLATVLPTADNIRRQFEAIVEGKISAGIAIMGVKTPLDSALESARLAEAMAKDEVDRDAVVIRDMRSSTIREVGAKWGDITSDDPDQPSLIEYLQQWFKAEKISTKLGYDMLELAYWMGGDVPEEARTAELRRLLNRRTERGTKLEPQEAEYLLDRLTNLAQTRSWETAAQWVIMARFLAKGGERGN